MKSLTNFHVSNLLKKKGKSHVMNVQENTGHSLKIFKIKNTTL